mgnify:FL=1
MKSSTTGLKVRFLSFTAATGRDGDDKQSIVKQDFSIQIVVHRGMQDSSDHEIDATFA